MKVFISWSKDRSRAVATAFADFLPLVIQQCDDVFISTDIDKGSAWFGAITEALVDAKVGVLFVTPENQSQEWLNFEAGAMLTKFTQQRVRPVLVDLTVAGYEGPMANMNFTRVSDKDDMRKLLHDINKECKPPLLPAILDRAFDNAWSEFETRVATAIDIDVSEGEKPPERALEDKVDEILELMRETRRNEEFGTSASEKVRRGRAFLKEREGLLSQTGVADLNSERWDRTREEYRRNHELMHARVDLPSPLGDSVIEGGRWSGTITGVEVSLPDGTPVIVRVTWKDDRPDSLENVSEIEIAPF